MPDIGKRCHELRVREGRHNWRIIYRIDPAAIVVVEVFAKTTPQTPRSIIDLCRERLSDYDRS
jgi:phage-related protein